MALDLVSAPFPGETRPKKRPRLGWDVGPLFSDEASRLQLQLATQILSAQSLPFDQLVQHGNGTVLPSAATDLSLGTAAQFSWMSGNQMAPIWREDDKDGHLQFEIGDILNSRYRVLNKMGEGTFGRVLECQDIETKELVAVKVIRSAEKYREAAMIEVDVLHTLHDNDKTGSRRRSEKYFKHGRELYWPEGAPSRDRIRAVRRLPRLKNLVMEHADHSAGLLIDLVEQLMKYDSKERLTAREALEHPFFRAPSRR